MTAKEQSWDLENNGNTLTDFLFNQKLVLPSKMTFIIWLFKDGSAAVLTSHRIIITVTMY